MEKVYGVQDARTRRHKTKTTDIRASWWFKRNQKLSRNWEFWRIIRNRKQEQTQQRRFALVLCHTISNEFKGSEIGGFRGPERL